MTRSLSISGMSTASSPALRWMRWLKSLRIKALQVYIFGNNLMTWTSYSGYDPEFSSSNPLQIGRDTYRYPMKREFGAGINVKF